MWKSVSTSRYGHTSSQRSDPHSAGRRSGGICFSEHLRLCGGGRGLAGCVLADRLSADGASQVAVIEAGGSDRNPAVLTPKGFAFLLTNPRFVWDYDIEPFGPDQQAEHWVRGKILGGRARSTAWSTTAVSRQTTTTSWRAAIRAGVGRDPADLPGVQGPRTGRFGYPRQRRTAGISINETGEEVSEALLIRLQPLGSSGRRRQRRRRRACRLHAGDHPPRATGQCSKLSCVRPADDPT